jgi:hypothetical protein
MGGEEGDAMANVECLRQLRRVVEEAPADRFDMRDFCLPTSCGTAYCAAGWAAIDPWFRANTRIGEWFRGDAGDLLYIHPNARFGLQEIFGLEETATKRLFALGVDCWAPAMKRAVLANIDRLLAGKRARSYADMVADRG